MSRRAAFAFACVIAFAAVPAPGAITLRFEKPDVRLMQPQVYSIDVFARGVAGDTENEQLFAYDIGFVLETFGGNPPAGIRFAPPYATQPTGDEGFVFGAQPTEFAVSGNPAPEPGRFLLNVVNNGTTKPDITSDRVRVARVFVQVEPRSGSSLTSHRLRFDPELTVFGSGDASRNIRTDAGHSITFIVPEPSAVLPLGAAALALRRRRAPPAACVGQSSRSRDSCRRLRSPRGGPDEDE